MTDPTQNQAQHNQSIETAKVRMRDELNATREVISGIVKNLTPRELDDRPITGKWTMHDVVGHLVGWEKLALEAVRKTLAGEETRRMPGFADDRVDEINTGFTAAARELTWKQVWADYNHARNDMLGLLAGCSAQDLSRSMISPWGSTYTLHRFFELWPEHDREHIAMIREETDLLNQANDSEPFPAGTI